MESVSNPALALAPGDGTSYAEPSKKSFQDRTYPLARSIYIFLNRAPGKPAKRRLTDSPREKMFSGMEQQPGTHLGEIRALASKVFSVRKDEIDAHRPAEEGLANAGNRTLVNTTVWWKTDSVGPSTSGWCA